MKKKFLRLVVVLLCMSGGMVAQNTKREALIDSIVNFSLKQLNRVDMVSSAEAITKDSEDLDPVTIEAFIYANMKSIRPLLLESYAQLSDSELEETYRFMCSESNRRISSNEVSEMVGMFLGLDLVGYVASMIEGESWKPNLPSLNDKEYEALADKYIEQTNVMLLFDSMLKPLVANLGGEMDPSAIQMLTSMMNQLKDSYPQYYKWALLEYVSKEQLQEVLDYYNQPFVVRMQQDAKGVATSLVDQLTKDPESFLNQITEHFGNLDSVSDTSLIVQEYIKLLPSIPFRGEEIEPMLPVKTLAMKKKATYTGQTRNGVAHGKGMLTDKKGVRYSGDFKGGKRHGVITTYYTTGDSITQVWADDKVMKEQNTNVKIPVPLYKGQAMGYGFRYSDGDREEGFFIDGMLEGYGAKKMADGETTESGWFHLGTLVNGRTTTGNLNSGLIEFEGEQSQNLSHGNLKTGTLTVKTTKDVITMKGNFINNYQLHGMGSFELDGKVAYQHEEGLFAYGKLYGEGHRTCKWKERNASEVYDGEFFAGEYQGKGIRKEYLRNEKYDNTFTKITDAEFYEGKVNGEMVYEEYITNISGIWTFTRFGFEMPYSDFRMSSENSISEVPVIRIIGTAIDDKLNGDAEITLSNGDYYKGTFKNGEFVEGTVRITYSDASMYEGEMKNGKYEGKGKYTEPYGFSDEGTFLYGICIDGVRKNEQGKVLWKIR